MAGLVQRIVPLQQFDSAVTIGSANTVIAYSARRIDVSGWREANLIARLHSTTSWTNSATLVFFVGPDGFTDEDPAPTWAMPNGTAVVTFNQGGPQNDAAPSVRIGSIASLLGTVPSLIWLQVRMVGGGTPSRITVVASCDLNMKGQ